MAIKTSTFGGVTLTGNTATVFKKQFLSKNAKSDPSAQASLDEGRRMLKKYKKTGFVAVKSGKDN